MSLAALAAGVPINLPRTSLVTLPVGTIRDETYKVDRPLILPQRMRNRNICGLVILALTSIPRAAAQSNDPAAAEPKPSALNRTIDILFNYLNMAGAEKASDFQPLTQRERTHIYLKTMVNPLGYLKAGFSAGIDQWKDKPEEWEQGASGYGKRCANILGQYSIQRTVTFGLGSLLHEDNRYFNSGKRAFWPRVGYSMVSGILARHDDGTRHVSISQLGGVAAGAFLSRTWQPPSQSSAGDGAVSFGITMASNMGFGVVKEFLPDLGRAIDKKRKKSSARGAQPKPQTRTEPESRHRSLATPGGGIAMLPSSATSR